MKSSFLRSDLDTSCYHWPLDFRHKASSPQEAPPVGLDWGQAWGIHGGWVPWIQDDVLNLWYLFKWFLVYLLICLICRFISIYHLSSYLSTVYRICILYIDLYVCFVGGGLLVWSCRFQGVHTGSREPYLVWTRCPSHISPYEDTLDVRKGIRHLLQEHEDTLKPVK